MSSITENKKYLFESMNPAKALAIMALPTVGSQMVVLIYNIADTWFIGRTDNPAMIAASNFALTVYLIAVSLANVFGVGGGSLMARLVGERKETDAAKVVNYSVFASGIAAGIFSILTFIFMTPLMRLLGSEEATLHYCKQYLLTTVVFGSIPTVLSMSMPQLLRNAGYSKEAGLGVAIGSLLNVALDPLFMFVILPSGNEVLGAGIATMISNYVSLAFFIYIFHKVKNESILKISFKPVHLEKKHLQSLYMVGVPAAISIFLFDLVNIVINRLVSTYGDHTTPVAAIGIVLKLERIPINIGLGVCLGMVPLIAYNFGAGNQKRMARFSSLARWAILIFSSFCTVLFFLFAEPLVSLFIKDPTTVEMGTAYLKMRCFALPFMMIGYHVVNYMNAINQGKVSFALAIIRHLILIIPIMFIMNYIWGITGLMWAQVIADVINSAVALLAIQLILKRSRKESSIS